MRPHLVRALALLSPILLTACATTTTTSTWNDAYAGYPADGARYGRVESIRTTVRRQDGNPGAGAAAGAVVGGLLGSMIGGHTSYDRWGNGYHHGSAAGAVVGAIGGAMVGAAASQGSSEERFYDVYVRFDDGGLDVFLFHDPLPFQVGDPVNLTSRGLERL
jgi:outer membrane lipoprotein SlyB